MALSQLDWLIILIPLLVVTGIAWRALVSSRRGMIDFLVFRGKAHSKKYRPFYTAALHEPACRK